MLCWESLRSIFLIYREYLMFSIYVFFNVVGLDLHMWLLDWMGEKKHCSLMTSRHPWICNRNESVLNTTFSIKYTLLFCLSSWSGSVEQKPNDGTIHYCQKQIKQNLNITECRTLWRKKSKAMLLCFVSSTFIFIFFSRM